MTTVTEPNPPSDPEKLDPTGMGSHMLIDGPLSSSEPGTAMRVFHEMAQADRDRAADPVVPDSPADDSFRQLAEDMFMIFGLKRTSFNGLQTRGLLDRRDALLAAEDERPNPNQGAKTMTTDSRTDSEALDQIAAALGLHATDPENNPVDELISTITANVQVTGRSTDTPEGA